MGNRAVDPDFPPFLENWYLSARIIRRFELVRLLAIERRLDNNLTEAETGNLRIFFCNGTSKTTTSLERRLTTARRRRQPHDLRLSPGYTAIGLRQEQSATTSSLLTALPQPSTPLPTIALLTNTLDFLQWLTSLPKQGYTNLTRNAVHMWDDMSTINYIRMIAIVGGYLFLRPYLQKWGERQQAKQHEKMLSQNALRAGGGGKSVSFADEGGESASESGQEGGKEEWGKKEKKRQRKVVEKKIAEAEEGSDEIDIMEHLVDYEEGKDGW